MCYLRKNPGGGSKNNNRRGGWKMPCSRSVPKCTATFQHRGGSHIDKLGVCGTSLEHLDSQCCQECAKHPDCEFWVREANNPDYRHGAMNSSFCYLRKNGAVKASANANWRGGGNRICGSPDTPACRASFQEGSGSQVAAVRVLNKYVSYRLCFPLGTGLPGSWSNFAWEYDWMLSQRIATSTSSESLSLLLRFGRQSEAGQFCVLP